MRVPDHLLPLTVAAAGVAAALALGVPDAPVLVRAAGALLLGFALPGTALLLGLLPRIRLRRSERVAIALGGSIATTIGCAFLLHALPSGLSATSWAATLGAITVVGATLGWVRARRRAVVAEPWAEGAPGEAVRTLVAPGSVAMLTAAGVLMVLAFVIARSGVAVGPTAAFTELWLLPTDTGGTVRVGVANHEGGERDYRLEITVDGQPLRDPVTVTLADGDSTDAVLELPRGRGPREVEARLWFADQREGTRPHRQVDLVVPARAEPAA